MQGSRGRRAHRVRSRRVMPSLVALLWPVVMKAAISGRRRSMVRLSCRTSGMSE